MVQNIILVLVCFDKTKNKKDVELKRVGNPEFFQTMPPHDRHTQGGTVSHNVSFYVTDAYFTGEFCAPSPPSRRFRRPAFVVLKELARTAELLHCAELRTYTEALTNVFVDGVYDEL